MLPLAADNSRTTEARPKQRKPKAAARREQDIFRRVHYIHETVKRKDSGVASAGLQSRKTLDEDRYLKDLPPLHKAAADGDVKALRHLLDDLNVDIESEGGCDNATALHYAAYKGCEDAARFLIECSAKVESKDKDGATPLHWSIPFGHVSMFKLLVESGADIMCQTVIGNTPLHWCGWKDQVTIAKILLEEGVDVDIRANDGHTPLMLVEGERPSEEMVRFLVDEGADLEARDDSLQTALHYSVENDSTAMVQTLLELGADVNATGKNSRTPLLEAARHGYAECFRLILESNADVNASDIDENTALHFAVVQNDPTIALNLLAFGAEITTNDDRETPLHRIKARTHVSVITALLSHGVDIEAIDYRGFTPLHQAAATANSTACQRLLDAGANVDSLAEMDRTPLHIAAQRGHGEVIHVLLSAGADTLAANTWGKIPLHLTAPNGSLDAARLLLSFDHATQQLAAKDAVALTAFCMAAFAGHIEMAKLLMEDPSNEDSWPVLMEGVLKYSKDEIRQDMSQWYLDHGFSLPLSTVEEAATTLP